MMHSRASKVSRDSRGPKVFQKVMTDRGVHSEQPVGFNQARSMEGFVADIMEIV